MGLTSLLFIVVVVLHYCSELSAWEHDGNPSKQHSLRCGVPKQKSSFDVKIRDQPFNMRERSIATGFYLVLQSVLFF